MNKTHLASGMKLRRAVQLGLAGLALACTVPAWAVAITVENGGIVLNSTDTSTVGDAGDPWVIDETMTSSGTLRFEGDPLGGNNPTGSGHAAGKWFQKIVTNNTGVDWTSFELELQVILGTPSGQGDGLSFADGSALTGLFSSDVFSTYTRIEDTRDYLNFHGGTVADGATVTFNFVITDNLGNDPFYLLQTPNKQEVPEPGTLALLGLAGIGMFGLRRRKLAS